jgi:hypothetical protein
MAALISAGALDTASAQAIHAPWCAVTNQGFGDMHWDCQYQTVEQCTPHVLSGNRGFCNENPYYTGPSHPARRASRRHRVHHG